MKTIKQLIDMSGRSTLITGATGCLGRYMAETVSELGSDLILVDLPGTCYKDITKNLNKFNTSIECFDCDLEHEKERNSLICKINDKKLPVNVLINNAAFGGETKLDGWITPFEEQSVKTWKRALDVNLTAAFDLSKQLMPQLKNNSNGTIINIASIYGVTGPIHTLYKDVDMGNPAAYAVSKGGLIQLTRWLATTIAPDVRVNAISPGGIFRSQPEKFLERYKKRTPLGRMATEEDFKGIVAYLASDLSNYVTGQNFNIDGGWTAW